MHSAAPTNWRTPTEDTYTAIEADSLAGSSVDGTDDALRCIPGEVDPGCVAVVIADGHEIARAGLRMLLEREDSLEVIADCATLREAETLVVELRPDVLILDLDMPGGCDLGDVAALTTRSPWTRIVALATSQDPAFARLAMERGAMGYLLRDAGVDELVDAVRGASQGERYLAPAIGARLAVEGRSRPDRLSAREMEVLGLIADGHTNAEIASRLGRSVRTVESHRQHIQRKVGLRTRAQLVAYARERGLVAA